MPAQELTRKLHILWNTGEAWAQAVELDAKRAERESKGAELARAATDRDQIHYTTFTSVYNVRERAFSARRAAGLTC